MHVKKYFFSFLLLTIQAIATDAIWESTTNNNMANPANWSSVSVVPDGTATFDSSIPNVQTNLIWNNGPFTLESFNFTRSASRFNFTFSGLFGLQFTGAGITGQSTNTTFNFDTGSSGTMTFPQLLIAPNGSSDLGQANITAINNTDMDFLTSGPTAQLLLDGSASTANDNQCTVTGNQNTINLTNNGPINGSGALPLAQLCIDGSSNGLGNGTTVNAGNGSASLTTTNSNFTIQNNNVISSDTGIFFCESVGQWVVNGTSNGTGNFGFGNGGISSASLVTNGGSITIANTGFITVPNAGFGISESHGQWVINGSSNGVGFVGAGSGGEGSATYEANDCFITINNSGAINNNNATLQSSIGQWVVDGSSNGASISGGDGDGKTSTASQGNVSSTISNSTIALTNTGSVQGVSSNGFLIGSQGQLVIDGSSNASLGTSSTISSEGGMGNALFSLDHSTMTFNNGGQLTGGNGVDIYGAVGQLVVNGTSNAFNQAGVSAIADTGNASFFAERSLLKCDNSGIIFAAQGGITHGAAAQVAIDGSSNGVGNNSTLAQSTSGNASFTLKKSFLALSNSGNILGGTPSLVNVAGQMVITGSSNQSDTTATIGRGKAALTLDNSRLTLTNSGSVQGQFSGALAGQLVFDGSVNQVSTGVNSYAGSAVLHAKKNDFISVTNEAAGTITTVDTTPAQVYFHNASIKGSPYIWVANYNNLALIEGVLFDQNSSAGNATFALNNTSLVVNTTPAASPFSIGGLSGDQTSKVKLLTNDLQINTAADITNTFAGVISGNHALFIAGRGTQILSGDNTFTGLTTVKRGTLGLNGSVLESVLVKAGTIYGNGKIGKDLTFTPSATYLVKVTGIPFATTCLHAKGKLTPAGTLKVTTANGTYAIGQPYTILTGKKLSDSRFSTVVTDSPWLVATPIYDFDPSVQLLLTTNFSAGARTCNECRVAKQLDSIEIPDADEASVINALLGLNGKQLPRALNQLSGVQYAYLTQIPQMADRRFSGRIFEAVRNAIRPASCRFSCKQSSLWVVAQGGRYEQNSRFNTRYFDISLGAHYQFRSVLIGVAGNYERNWLHFNSRNNFYTGQGALYALWKKNSFYLFSDLIGGASHSHIKRTICFNGFRRIAHSQPKFNHGAWYGEAGFDYLHRKTLFQPFFGFDATYVSSEKVCERGADAVNLNVRNRNTSCSDTYLGTHFTLCNSCIEFSGDLIWRCRLGSLGTKIHSRFLTFGDAFVIRGCDDCGRNSFISRLRVDSKICNFQVFGEFSGEWASKSQNWSFLGGVSRPL